MPATKEDLSAWFDQGIKQGAAHMVVVCDTFDYEDYPVYVGKDDDVQKVVTWYNAQSMSRVMEVYVLEPRMKIEQLRRVRAWRDFLP